VIRARVRRSPVAEASSRHRQERDPAVV
jgi:hypothetical protein